MIFVLKILNMYIPDVKNIFNCTSEVFSIFSPQNTRIISFLLYSDYIVFTILGLYRFYYTRIISLLLYSDYVVFTILGLYRFYYTRIMSFLLYSDYVVFTVAILGEIKAYNLVMKHFQKYFLQ